MESFTDINRYGKTEAQQYFYEDSPKNFMMLVNKKWNKCLDALSQGNLGNPFGGLIDPVMDMPIIKNEFLPAIERAIMDSWSKYPADRYNIDNSYKKHSDFPGYESLSAEVSKHFRASQRSYVSSTLPRNGLDVNTFLDFVLEFE